MTATARMESPVYHVIIAWDEEAAIYYVKESDIPGLNVEAETIDDMMEIMDDAIPTLLEANGCEFRGAV